MGSMKHLAVSTCAALVAGCLSMTAPQIGMSEKAWLRSTLVADVAHIEGDLRVYRSGGAYYYFRNGRLEKVDEGQAMPQKIEVEITHR